MKHDYLLSMSNEDIERMFRFKNVKVFTKEGEEVTFFVKALSVAANPPHLFVGFIMDNDHHFGMENIDTIEVVQ